MNSRSRTQKLVSAHPVARAVLSAAEQESLNHAAAKRWLDALESNGEGLWKWNISSGTSYFSPRWKNMLGFEDGEIGESLDEWSSRIHPDDLAHVYATLERYFHRETDVYEVEHRLRCRDGSYKWILSRGRVEEWTADGRPVRMAGTHCDITSHHQKRELLIENERRLRQMLDSITGVSVIATDPNGLIVFFSKGSESLLGYDAGEIVNHASIDILHEPEELRVHCECPSPAPEGAPFVIASLVAGTAREWTYVCRDGSRKAVELTVCRQNDAGGNPSGYICTALDITKRKRLENTLCESEQKFLGMFDLSPVGIALNDMETGLFLDANRALIETTAYTREELLALSHWQITPREYEEQEREHLRSLQCTGRCGPYEKEFVRKDGTRYPVLLHGMKLTNADGREVIYSIVQDVSDTRQIERSLREALDAQRVAMSLLEAAGQLARLGYWQYTLADRHLFLSDTAYAIYEVPSGTPLTFADVVARIVPDDQQRVHTLMQQVCNTGEPVDFEIRILTTSGRKIWTRFQSEAVRDETGQIAGLRGVIQDVDDRHRAEELLTARNRQLEIANAQAQAHARAKAEFLANMSHEIRTPLNAIIGMSDLLGDAAISEREREFVDTIRASGSTLLTLINDILDFSKIESGQLDLEYIPLDLRECVESALDLVAAQAARQGLELLYWIEPSMPAIILGDVTRLRQIIVNLLSNAVKFTKRGEIFLRVSKTTGTDRQERLLVSVRDSGIGIAPDRQETLFQTFSQGDSSASRRYGGTGLGLAICRRLVHLMNGHIWVDSEPGRGSDFQFEIPVEPGPLTPAIGDQPGLESLEGLRLLIVDDNLTNCWTLKSQTSAWGMSAHMTHSPEEALAWIADGRTYDLAIVDAHMSGMNGYELAAAIREYRTYKELPILLLSQLTEASRQYNDCGIAGRLTMPVKISALYDSLCTILLRPRTLPPPKSAGHEFEINLHAECPLRVLVAEDNPVNQRVTSLLLDRLGYRPEVVANGLEVLAALERIRFDVILLDIQMPEMDGLQTAREICRRYPRAQRPRIIALTADAIEGDREECLAAGMDDYLSKPVRGQQLASALRTSFEVRKQR